MAEEENKFLAILAIDDCGGNVLNWLSIDDLVALNRTCTQLQAQTAKHFQAKYPWQFIGIRDGGAVDTLELWPKTQSRFRFTQHFRNVTIVPSPTVYKYLLTTHNDQLMFLDFYGQEIAQIDGNILGQITPNIKIIKVTNATFDAGIYDCLLQHCHRMEHLIIEAPGELEECTQRGQRNQWQRQHYPNLKHFYWSSNQMLPNFIDLLRNNHQISYVHLSNNGELQQLSINRHCYRFLRHQVPIPSNY